MAGGRFLSFAFSRQCIAHIVEECEVSAQFLEGLILCAPVQEIVSPGS